MTVFAIDPGEEQSGWVLFDGHLPRAHGIEPNAEVLTRLRSLSDQQDVVIERIEGFGKMASRAEFRTAEWSGRFFEAVEPRARVEWLTRRAVKLHLTGVANTNDKQLREVLVERFPSLERVKGKGARALNAGLLRSHEWAAFAVAVVYHDLHGQPKGE